MHARAQGNMQDQTKNEDESNSLMGRI